MDIQPLSFTLGERFSGPLDLLLQLIAKNKVEITDIPISEILDQYLEEITRPDMDAASDFIVMAAQLVLIKTRMLLPKPPEEEEDPRAELISSLLEFKKYKELSPLLDRMFAEYSSRYTKVAEVRGKARYEYRHEPYDLKRALDVMTERSEAKRPAQPEAFRGIVGHEPEPVEPQISRILDILIKNGSAAFSELYSKAKRRSELVAVFLALLELMATKKVQPEGDGIIISEGEVEEGN